MLSLEEKLKIFWVTSPQNKRAIPTIQLGHSQMSRTYYLWPEPYTSTINTGSGTVTVEPANFTAKLADTANNLDQKYTITLELIDSQDIFRNELDRISVNTSEKILLTYREYLSDNLNAPQAQVTLTVATVAFTVDGAQFECTVPKYNKQSTGELYTPFGIPLLRGFL